MPKKKAENHHAKAQTHHHEPTPLLQSSRLRPSVMVAVMALLAVVGVVLVYHSFAASDSLSVVPATSSPALGANFTITIHENSNTDAVNAVEADLTYDSTKLQYVSSDTTGNTNFNSGNGTCIAPTVSTGSVKFACAKFGSGITGDQSVATVTFTAIAPGSAAVSFANTSQLLLASDSTNVLAATTGGTYTIADTTAPTTPTGLTAGTKTVNSIAISWTASTDNVGVTGYKIFRNGTQIGTSSTTSFTSTGLTPNTSYSFTVAANDAAGNTSAQSSVLAVSTLPDTTAPSVPTGLTAGTKTVTSNALSWTASTDNVGVTTYKVFRNGAQVGTTASTSYTDSGLVPNTSYTYTVAASDAAGNTSAQSTGLAMTTLADTTAPSVPSGLVSTSQTETSIALSWTGSSDNVAVTGYKIFRNGTQVGTSPTTSFTDSGLAQNTSYTYAIAAFDGAGNTSAQTSTSTFKTTTLTGDINSDGIVNISDLSIMAAHFRQSGGLAQGDLNGDGVVDVIDLSILAANWGK